MVSISAERINATSPYKVSMSKDQGFVVFTTDSDVNYRVGFEPLDVMTSSEVYQFYIINVNRKQSPRDPKLRDTIMAIIYDFFLSSNTAMLYICETGDMKQSMRERLFRYWASANPKHTQFSIWTASVLDEAGVMNYATLILRNDHPKRKEVVEEFTDTVNMLNNKPD